ncbi:Gfo/Idh/MocA family protein [Haladaptatus caseinilyticus]|uniref:Gfo/Idh/MocA family protein n=1 Tax=Haladaptatus caseinilyticus TaxID=2993314 RepID=UPI00224AEE40|nr:Gfo/Idh/MocA family oxidoreductase [Haladaptatus caseinilyticus]
MTYTAGVIGFGRVGRNHAEAFLDNDDIELQAIADADPDLVAKMGSHWNIPSCQRYDRHSELLETERLDIVTVATPGHLHREHVIDAVNAEQPPHVILCEKPIATSVRDASRMVAACERAGVTLLVNHSRRFSECFQALFRLLHQTDVFGTIRSAEVVSGGELLNIGTHYMDLLLYLLDTRVKDVRGGYVEPISSHGYTRFRGGGTFVMENDVIATLNPAPGSADRLYLESDRGRLSMPLSIAQDADHECQFWRIEDGLRSLTEPPEPLEALWERDIDGVHSTFEPGMVPAQPLFENAVDHIVGILNGSEHNAVPGTRAVHGLEALFGTVISDFTGSRVVLPIEEPFRAVPLEYDI